jgi:hypothetical protein
VQLVGGNRHQIGAFGRGKLARPCTASHRNSAPMACARASSATGCTVPISLLTCITATTPVPSGIGTAGSTSPAPSTGSTVSAGS